MRGLLFYFCTYLKVIEKPLQTEGLFCLSLFGSMSHFIDRSKRRFNANEYDKEYYYPTDQICPNV